MVRKSFVDVNMGDSVNGNTALMMAAELGSHEAVGDLLDEPTLDVYQTNHASLTALDIAASSLVRYAFSTHHARKAPVQSALGSPETDVESSEMAASSTDGAAAARPRSETVPLEVTAFASELISLLGEKKMPAWEAICLLHEENRMLVGSDGEGARHFGLGPPAAEFLKSIGAEGERALLDAVRRFKDAESSIDAGVERRAARSSASHSSTLPAGAPSTASAPAGASGTELPHRPEGLHDHGGGARVLIDVLQAIEERQQSSPKPYGPLSIEATLLKRSNSSSSLIMTPERKSSSKDRARRFSSAVGSSLHPVSEAGHLTEVYSS
jgi:hypothetical protein